MSNQDEKAKRVKYLRALEKFAKSAVTSLKRDDFDENEFRLRMNKNAKIFEKAQAVYLDNAYTKELENFVNLVFSNGEKTQMIKSANLLDKLRNQKTYKKEKHKNSYKDEH
ncbi:hypothetical protein [Campylobacter majalis]|uniref:hypothetical protein n=1 Tax=Campylobacter majalis TaxID=2790656 RepID=UPI003D6883C3